VNGYEEVTPHCREVVVVFVKEDVEGRRKKEEGKVYEHA
jgi:hypothetical protein